MRALETLEIRLVGPKAVGGGVELRVARGLHLSDERRHLVLAALARLQGGGELLLRLLLTTFAQRADPLQAESVRGTVHSHLDRQPPIELEECMWGLTGDQSRCRVRTG